MRFIFWQNIVSIHQSAFLKALSLNNDVTLIVEKNINKERKEQGWIVPGLDTINVIAEPSKSEMSKLLDNSAVHVFTGIDAYPMVSTAFKIAVKRKLRKGVMLEPFEWLGLKGKLRWLKYKYLILKYKDCLNFIITTGQKGVIQYRSLGFNNNKIFEWGYFVETEYFDSSQILSPSSKPKLLFVGRLDENKNIMLLVETVKKYSDLIDKLTIVGDGPLKKEVLAATAPSQYIDYLGLIPNEDVREQMRIHDLLILPSSYDGWGAVVNEALHSGMRVIASENCGASTLLDGRERGEKFGFTGANNFEEILIRWIRMGSLGIEDRTNVAIWSANHISGKKAAAYFEAIIEHIFDKSPKKPTAPWRI